MADCGADGCASFLPLLGGEEVGVGCDSSSVLLTPERIVRGAAGVSDMLLLGDVGVVNNVVAVVVFVVDVVVLLPAVRSSLNSVGVKE